MPGICHLVIKHFIFVKNRSQGVIIHLPVGKINVIYMYIYRYIYYIHDFDVTMGSYVWAEVCQLSGILTGNKYNLNNIGLYRDDGLAIFKNTSGRNLTKLERFFKKCLRT